MSRKCHKNTLYRYRIYIKEIFKYLLMYPQSDLQYYYMSYAKLYPIICKLISSCQKQNYCVVSWANKTPVECSKIKYSKDKS